MKARMTSRVTVMPKLESMDESPAKGRRNGTRARAVAKWAARSDTSSATIGAGAVLTSGRLPIAMFLTSRGSVAPSRNRRRAGGNLGCHDGERGNGRIRRGLRLLESVFRPARRSGTSEPGSPAGRRDTVRKQHTL